MFENFSKVETLGGGFVFSLGCALAGLPVLLVAPQSGGKSTIIEACKKWLNKNKEKTIDVSRVGLRTIREIASDIIRAKEVTLLNDDYSLIGEDDYMVKKMAEIISSLSYSKSFYDYGLKATITVKRLGFISGVQPLWIKTLMDSRAFATNMREKFIRYYLLPYKASRDIPMSIATDILSKNQPIYNQNGKVTVPKVFIDSLAFQIGRTRANEFTERLVEQFKKLIPIWMIPKYLKYFSVRIGFEKEIVNREFKEYGYEVDVFWKGYTTLYWALRRGKITRKELSECLGVTSYRSVSRALKEAEKKRWILKIPTKNAVYLPNYNIFKVS